MTTKLSVSSTPTINDVARVAGVSKRTVSRVINSSALVNPVTKEKILETIKSLGFTPNSQARALASKRSYLIGLVYDNPTFFISESIKVISKLCSHLDFEVVVRSCSFEDKELIPTMQSFIKRSRIDGVIVLPPVSEVEGMIAGLSETGCKFVRFTSEVDDAPERLVATNYEPAIQTLVAHLVENEHVNIGVVTGPETDVSSIKRLKVFKHFLNERGLAIKDHNVVVAGFNFDSALEPARRLLSQPNRPTAIFALNDEMAMATIRVATELGIRVPDQLSVLGFDGSPMASWFLPSLSTIQRPVRAMAELATHKLLAAIQSIDLSPTTGSPFVSPNFLPGNSSGPAPR